MIDHSNKGQGFFPTAFKVNYIILDFLNNKIKLHLQLDQSWILVNKAASLKGTTGTFVDSLVILDTASDLKVYDIMPTTLQP